ncbi:hypothetical protein ACI2LF_17535 [Kribbella sp. NPDC020789]
MGDHQRDNGSAHGQRDTHTLDRHQSAGLHGEQPAAVRRIGRVEDHRIDRLVEGVPGPRHHEQDRGDRHRRRGQKGDRRQLTREQQRDDELAEHSAGRVPGEERPSRGGRGPGRTGHRVHYRRTEVGQAVVDASVLGGSIMGE